MLLMVCHAVLRQISNYYFCAISLCELSVCAIFAFFPTISQLVNYESAGNYIILCRNTPYCKICVLHSVTKSMALHMGQVKRLRILKVYGSWMLLLGFSEIFLLANISWTHCVPLFYCVSVRLLFWRWREIWTINLGVSGDVPVVNAKNWVIGTHDANDYYDDEEEVNYDDEGGDGWMCKQWSVAKKIGIHECL